MQLLRLDSTSLDRVGYDPDSKVLLVVFRDHSSYHYDGVPYAIFENLRQASSKGAYFNCAIRGSYSFRPVRWED